MNTPHIFKENRLLVITILLSLVWHLLWIALIKVDLTPRKAKQVNFTKVSFLGSLLSGVSVEFSVSPQERSSLERHFDSLMRSAGPSWLPPGDPNAIRYSDDPDLKSNHLVPYLEAIFAVSKLEPDL